MAYVVPIHRPGSVRHAVKPNFLEPDRACLIVAKANRLEIYELTAEGLVLRHTKALFGKVTMLDRLRPTSSSTDHLFVGTDRHLYFTLSWDPATKQLRTEKAFVDQSDAAGRDSQSSDRCAIDPAGNVLAMELFEGIMTILPIVADGKSKAVNGDTTGALGEPTAVRIPELFIRSWAWLHARPTAPQPKRKAAARGPRLAMLFDDSHGKVRLRVKELQHVRGADDVDLVDCDATQKDVEPSASHVVPVPAPAYGLLVLAERSVTYVDEESTAAYRHPLESPTIWAAWAPVDETRWLLGDDYGRLFFLMLRIAEDGEVQGFKIDSIGKVSRASVITYLDGGYAFIGSHSGDSQVIKIGPGSFDVVQSLSNIGPVLDFTVMDMGNRSDESQTNEYSSGQARIVTGSGAFEDGSLRSVRSGVGIEELGSLGSMPSVTQLFSLKSNWASEWDDVLVASLIDETRVFRFAAGGEIEELQSLHGLQLDESTLLAQDLLNGLILQCTSSAVRLVDIDSEMVTASWTPDAGSPIVAASANEQEVVVSIAGLELVALNLASNLTVIARQEPGAGQQVSCVDVPSVVTSICVVGFWQHAEVAILQTQTLQEVSRTTVSEDEAAVPRSVLLTQIIPDHNPNLFVALADGNVVTFDVQSSKYLLTDRKSTILGTQQANFKALPRGEGLFNVFATCEHPSLIYGSEGRIVYSAVTIENASYVCNFNAEAYPGAIAMAANEELKLALVDTERTTHVQKLHIGETVRRLAYSPKHKAFGMGTISRRLEKAAEVVQSHFKLADEVIFEQLHTYDLRVDELVECVMRADVVDTFQGKAERFVVGTAYMSEKQPELPRGRILLFEVTADRVLQLVTELDVRGACRALAVVQGKIVAALVKAVVIYSLENGKLTKDATYRTSTMPIDICVTNDTTIAIADVMRSVSIVQYQPGVAGEHGRLDEVARHFHVAWSSAVAPVSDDSWLLADAESNLAVLRRNAHGVTADDQRRLETTSEIRLGELVNRIRPISVPASPAAVVLPRAFMATADGSIYLFALIRPEMQDRLMRLQSNLAAAVQSLGHVPFAQYRAFKNRVREASEPFRFVDGELVERFLDCAPDLQDQLVEDLGVDAGEIREMVESLRRVH